MMKPASLGRTFTVLIFLPRLVLGGETGLPSPVVPAGLGVATHFTDPAPGK